MAPLVQGPREEKKTQNTQHRTQKGWLAIAQLKPLSRFISLFQHFQMLSKSSLIEKWKLKVVLAD